MIPLMVTRIKGDSVQKGKTFEGALTVNSSTAGSVNSGMKNAAVVNSAVCGSRVTGTGCRRARMMKKGWVEVH